MANEKLNRGSKSNGDGGRKSNSYSSVDAKKTSTQFEGSRCCCLPDPFRGMGAWRKTMGPQKPGNSPGSGPEVVERKRVAK